MDVEQIRQNAILSITINEFIQKCGYKTFSNGLRKIVKDNNIDVSNLIVSHSYIDNITDDQFKEIVKNNTVWKKILNECGYSSYKGMHKIRQRIDKLQLSVDHINSIPDIRKISKYTLEEICIQDSWYSSGPMLVKRLKKELGWQHECSKCKLTEWQGQTIPIQLDHINGKHYDNRIENLRFLCPNCHAQTDTYTGKNLGKKGKKGFMLEKAVTRTVTVPILKQPIQPKNKCMDCGKDIKRKSTRCLECYKIASRIVSRPSHGELIQELKNSNFTKVGKKYGVSDNTIKKWLISYEKSKLLENVI